MEDFLAAGNLLPVPDSALEKVKLDIPGCETGWNFKIKVPFKSPAMFEMYGNRYRKMGMDSVPYGAIGERSWVQSPSLNPVDSGAQKLSSQRMYADKSMECSIYAWYLQLPIGNKATDSLRWDGDTQMVTVVCGPDLGSSAKNCFSL
ncbi:MAG: hypothetical protein JWP91_3939 [Fibrobacteres bacterium]|nr:hypothetical protein [Fibrobacterota bacterium]